MADVIVFTRNNTDLAGTYYLGVYGYSYASFSILTTVKRDHATKLEKYRDFSVMLYEAVPLKKSLHNEFDFFFAYFDVEIGEEDNFSI